eukprot:9984763-Heterocapsa_arctica.AAC.1
MPPPPPERPYVLPGPPPHALAGRLPHHRRARMPPPPQESPYVLPGHLLPPPADVPPRSPRHAHVCPALLASSQQPFRRSYRYASSPGQLPLPA